MPAARRYTEEDDQDAADEMLEYVEERRKKAEDANAA